ncbi:uncharacterized protein LOC117903841 isoform X3 [Drosophila subobscura]|uniref:uncharacterized protein LOC117903841 isoform X3 n=1 Tax=Drosophila subobscura TaxID=7241 RepID=UPI00155B2C5D|nr:uncharacterized protein LOC117903841 isoform X3 [Drosophila subobscura]
MDDELCRICIGSHASGSPMQMISIFGEDSLWQKITTLANVQISKNDTLPQQVCVECAKTAISACLFKKKCEDADNFYRQQLLLKKIEGDAERQKAGGENRKEEAASGDRAKSRGGSTASSSGTASGSGSGSATGSGSSSSSSSSDDDEDEDNDNATGNGNEDDHDDASVAGEAEERLQNGHGHAINGHLVEDPNDEDAEDEEQEQEEQHHQFDLDDGQRPLLVDEQQDQSGIELSNGVGLGLGDGEDEDLAVMHRGESPDQHDDGEITVQDGHPKEPFDFNSIRLMQEYMQHQMNKFPNGAGLPGHDPDLDHQHEVDEDDDDEEMTLPLIPEIELITPGDDSMIGPDMAADHSAAAAHEAGQQVMRGTPGFQCPHCYQTFDMKQILKAHMQSVHGAPGPVYECSNCRKTYFYKRFLEKHIRRGRCVKKRRNQTRPMQCSDCHVLFPTGHHLGWHKRTGCPSKAAKMPLQQLFKQNIVQFNNFPKRVPATGGGTGGGAGAGAGAGTGTGPARKPTAPDLHVNSRKLGLVNKRKGRTRIKLDAKKIALAKQLILREATTTVIANELNISRTFAWRLRKSLVNGVSLHERVVDQAAEEQLQQQHQQHIQAMQQQQEEAAAAIAAAAEREREHQHLSLPYGHLGLGLIKEERQDSEDEEQQEQQQLHHPQHQHQHQLHSSLALGDECGADEIGAEETAGYMGDEDAVCSLLHNGYDMRGQLEDPDPDSDPVEHDSYEGNENERHSNTGGANSVSLPPPPLATAPVQVPVHVPSRPTVEVYKRLLAESQHFPHIVNAQQLQLHQQQQQQQQQQQLRHQTPADTSHFQQQPQPHQQQHRQLPPPKLPLPRRRLKAAERELRDKNITREILELIEEDSNIQYWKVSARLAEKGINISPSSVCQKLKSMGIHRRWKPGDKPSMLAISQIKAATVAAALAVGGVGGLGVGVGASSGGGSGSHSFGGVDDGYEQQQFDMGGPHFLSAFTR